MGRRSSSGGSAYRLLPVGDDYALVDADRYLEFRGYLWHLHEGYASTSTRRSDGTFRGLHIGRMVLGVEHVHDPRYTVDYVNGDRLDCRRENLRWCTRRQQLANTTIDRQNTTGFKGIFPTPFGGGWGAGIRSSTGRIRRFGFSTAEEAARAYDALAREIYGDFARYNFPRPGERSALRLETKTWPRLRLIEATAANEGDLSRVVRAAVHAAMGRTFEAIVRLRLAPPGGRRQRAIAGSSAPVDQNAATQGAEIRSRPTTRRERREDAQEIK